MVRDIIKCEKLKGSVLMINIPDKYRNEFDRSADFAINSGKFTVKELAEYLEVSELVASIMIGYMEKTELVTKGKLGEVRRARIGVDEWERIGKKIENYTPVPEEKPLPEIERQLFIKKEIYVTESALVLGENEIKYEDIREIFVFKPTLFKKGAAVFSCDNVTPKDLKKRKDIFFFKKKEEQRALKLCEQLASWLGIKISRIPC